MALQHSSKATPTVFPYKDGLAKAQIDRVQEITVSSTTNREKRKEIGRVGVADWKIATPEVAVTLRQLEYGELDTFLHLSNSATNDDVVDLNDFKTPKVDLAVYCTDDDDTFKSTHWLEKLRVSGFSLNIADPEADLERTFNLVGENYKQLQGNNKYLIQVQRTIASGEDGDVDIVIGSGNYSNYPAPVEDPNNSGEYILRATMYDSSAGTTSDISESTGAGTYAYVNGTTTITCNSAVADDIYTFYYSAGSYITGSSAWTDNDSDLFGIKADCVTILLKTTSDTVYELQSVNVDVTFDRMDEKEIGSTDPVVEGVREKNVRITLDRLSDDIRVEEIMLGQAADWGIVDIKDFLDNVTIAIKIYQTNAKSTFKLGYEFQNLTITSLDANIPIDEYLNKSVTLECSEGFITSDESDLTISA